MPMPKKKTLPELLAMKVAVTKQGFRDVRVLPNGCSLKKRPHVCCNCPLGEADND